MRRNSLYRCIFTAAGAILCALASSARADEAATVRRLVSLAPDLSPQVIRLALRSSQCASATNSGAPVESLGIIDYSRPSTQKRFWLFDVQKSRLITEDFVAHGRNTGDDRASAFSNVPGSFQSSIGLFQFGPRYIGKHGTSLRLIGLESGFNDRAFERALVIHGADYVSPSFIKVHKRLGRSQGCPALPQQTAEKVIRYLSDNSGYLFSYYPDKRWLQQSSYLNSCSGA